MDQLEATLLAMLIPAVAFTLWATLWAWGDERNQHYGWRDKYGKKFAPINGNILKAARARLAVYVALLAAQGFYLFLAVLAALASNGPPRQRSWMEWAIIGVCVALAAITSAGTIIATFLWRDVVRERQAEIDKTERIKQA